LDEGFGLYEKPLTEVASKLTRILNLFFITIQNTNHAKDFNHSLVGNLAFLLP
jgi:hypothetical protein